MGQPLSLCRCKSCQPPSSSYEKVLEMLPPTEKKMTTMEEMTMTSDVIQMHSDPYYVEYETDHGNQKITYDMIHDINVDVKKYVLCIGNHTRLSGKTYMITRLLWCIICMFEHHSGNTKWVGSKDDIPKKLHRHISRARNVTYNIVKEERNFKNKVTFEYFKINLHSVSIHGIIAKTRTMYVGSLNDVNHIKSICEAGVKPRNYTSITCKQCIIDTDDTFYVFDIKEIMIASHFENDVLRIVLRNGNTYEIENVNASSVVNRIVKNIK